MLRARKLTCNAMSGQVVSEDGGVMQRLSGQRGGSLKQCTYVHSVGMQWASDGKFFGFQAFCTTPEKIVAKGKTGQISECPLVCRGSRRSWGPDSAIAPAPRARAPEPSPARRFRKLRLTRVFALHILVPARHRPRRVTFLRVRARARKPIFCHALAARVRARKPTEFIVRAPAKRPQTPCCGKLCAGCNAVFMSNLEQSACRSC
jgi:hypothetical protein